MLRLLLAAAALLVTAAPVRAATVSLAEPGNGGYLEGPVLRVTAGAGEVNAMTVTAAAKGASVTVRDTGTPPTAGAGCIVLTPGAVGCAAPAGRAIDGGSVAL